MRDSQDKIESAAGLLAARVQVVRDALLHTLETSRHQNDEFEKCLSGFNLIAEHFVEAERLTLQAMLEDTQSGKVLQTALATLFKLFKLHPELNLTADTDAFIQQMTVLTQREERSEVSQDAEVEVQEDEAQQVFRACNTRLRIAYGTVHDGYEAWVEVYGKGGVHRPETYQEFLVAYEKAPVENVETSEQRQSTHLGMPVADYSQPKKFGPELPSKKAFSEEIVAGGVQSTRIAALLHQQLKAELDEAKVLYREHQSFFDSDEVMYPDRDGKGELVVDVDDIDDAENDDAPYCVASKLGQLSQKVNAVGFNVQKARPWGAHTASVLKLIDFTRKFRAQLQGLLDDADLDAPEVKRAPLSDQLALREDALSESLQDTFHAYWNSIVDKCMAEDTKGLSADGLQAEMLAVYQQLLAIYGAVPHKLHDSNAAALQDAVVSARMQAQAGHLQVYMSLTAQLVNHTKHLLLPARHNPENRDLDALFFSQLDEEMTRIEKHWAYMADEKTDMLHEQDIVFFLKDYAKLLNVLKTVEHARHDVVQKLHLDISEEEFLRRKKVFLKGMRYSIQRRVPHTMEDDLECFKLILNSEREMPLRVLNESAGYEIFNRSSWISVLGVSNKTTQKVFSQLDQPVKGAVQKLQEQLKKAAVFQKIAQQQDPKLAQLLKQYHRSLQQSGQMVLAVSELSKQLQSALTKVDRYVTFNLRFGRRMTSDRTPQTAYQLLLSLQDGGVLGQQYKALFAFMQDTESLPLQIREALTQELSLIDAMKVSFEQLKNIINYDEAAPQGVWFWKHRRHMLVETVNHRRNNVNLWAEKLASGHAERLPKKHRQFAERMLNRARTTEKRFSATLRRMRPSSPEVLETLTRVRGIFSEMFADSTSALHTSANFKKQARIRKRKVSRIYSDLIKIDEWMDGRNLYLERNKAHPAESDNPKLLKRFNRVDFRVKKLTFGKKYLRNTKDLQQYLTEIKTYLKQKRHLDPQHGAPRYPETYELERKLLRLIDYFERKIKVIQGAHIQAATVRQDAKVAASEQRSMSQIEAAEEVSGDESDDLVLAALEAGAGQLQAPDHLATLQMNASSDDDELSSEDVSAPVSPRAAAEQTKAIVSEHLTPSGFKVQQTVQTHSSDMHVVAEPRHPDENRAAYQQKLSQLIMDMVLVELSRGHTVLKIESSDANTLRQVRAAVAVQSLLRGQTFKVDLKLVRQGQTLQFDAVATDKEIDVAYQSYLQTLRSSQTACSAFLSSCQKLGINVEGVPAQERKLLLSLFRRVPEQLKLLQHVYKQRMARRSPMRARKEMQVKTKPSHQGAHKRQSQRFSDVLQASASGTFDARRHSLRGLSLEAQARLGQGKFTRSDDSRRSQRHSQRMSITSRG